jgi:hypothetical protein
MQVLTTTPHLLPHRYVPPKTRPELKPSSAEAPAVAEEFNDAAVRAFKEKEYQRSYVLWPLLATDGHQWPLMASNGLLWPLMASDGLWWPLVAFDGH